MRDGRRVGAALGVAAGYGLVVSAFATFVLGRFLALRPAERMEFVAATIVLLMTASAVTELVRGRHVTRR